MLNFENPRLDAQKHSVNARRAPVAVLLLAGIFLASCSSAPERPLEITTIRDSAENQLEAANKAADRGEYESAMDLLEEARRLAISTDRPELLIRESLSRGSVLFYLGRIAEAGAVWAGALAEAEFADDKVLASVCRLYIARSSIFRGSEIQTQGGKEEEAAGVLALVRKEMNTLKNSPLYTALAWTIIGLAEKECRRYAEAEKALQNSLEIHERERYLEQAAYDWYLIASVRSVAGRYAEAQAAIREALNYDRRAENSHGLGMDWLAIGDIYTKTGESALAASAYRRAADIFRSAGLEKNALTAEARLTR